MIKNWIRITLRILSRERAYAFINTAGLSLGVACCVVVGLYLYNEFNFDKHHEQGDQIYRLNEIGTRNGEIRHSSNVGGLVGPTLEGEYPEVLDSVRFTGVPGGPEFLFEYQDNVFYERELLATDNSVFDVFTHEIIAGDPETALLEPGSIAISESFANRYFGTEPAVGKVINAGASDYLVTLVFGDIPQTSHLWYSALVSIEETHRANPPNMTDDRHQTYLLMTENYQPESFETIWQDFLPRHLEGVRNYVGDTFYLEPLHDIYLYSQVGSGRSANVFALYAFATVGLFVLLIACINYMNLTTARSLKRAQEVGMRKVFGASKSQLVSQFLGESLIFSLAGVLLGIALASLIVSLNYFEVITGKSLSLSDLPLHLWFLSGATTFVVVGLLSGLYPAYSISGYLPIDSFKTKHTNVSGGLKFRNFLVAAQFVVSIAVIASTLLMYSQIEYVQNRSLGYSKEDRISIRLRGTTTIQRAKIYFNELVQSGQILGASIVSNGSEPGSDVVQTWPIGIPGIPFEQWRSFNRIYVDENFLDLMDVELVQGRNFNPTLETDRTSSVLVNETALREMGWEDPIGMAIGVAREGATIIGVIRDFHVRGLHQELRPTVVSYSNTEPGYLDSLPEQVVSSLIRHMLIHVESDKIGETLSMLNRDWSSIDPVQPLEFQLVEQQINQNYLPEQQQLQLFSVFSGICIFISCLGLLGLASFSTQQRTKEIGIRKVLGANVTNIIFMLFRSTLLILLVSAVVASGISFWASNQWLQRFYYQIDISPVVFVLATGMTAAIAFLTIASQAYKAARSNPVETLRYE